MYMLTSEQILSNLPFLLIFWTALTLCWGIYIGICLVKMMNFAARFKGGSRPLDSFHSLFLWLGNFTLLSYLFFEPELTNSFGDAIIVINIFFTSYLITASINTARWFKTKHLFERIEDSSDQLLT